VAKSYPQAKGRSSGGRHFRIPHQVSGHPNFIKLTAYPNKLLIDLGRQFVGSNNGDLCATWSLMEGRGWKSRETLNDALRELEYYGFIVMTQQGDRKKPTLYALGWRNIDKATGEHRELLNTMPNSWKAERKKFIKPSTRRTSKNKKAKKSVTRNAGQTSTVCGSKNNVVGLPR